ncbi:glycosyltransferase [Candidatus Saccharibacteria bacterium]|nr:glycosyltransferase [Candidatus Saccharibacteria bacterium]
MKNYSRRGFIITGRQTPYKRFDLAVEACTKLNLPLVVIGNGPDHAKLEAMAGPSVIFMTSVNDEQLAMCLQSAAGFIFPTQDDFGIAAVEALAAGTPVIAYKGGGALDYVVPGKTGVFFEQQTVDSLAKALQNFRSDNFSTHELRQAAQQFSPEHFRTAMRHTLEEEFA